ncbi:zinc finger domain-containing protein [Apiospora phragmitis]|uniref:Zinc finger domain-containing protein n=1 Tax=Apiospora phragmitis TaxID=2905665 RepID=A0ABR1VQ71_9PEZI
MPSLTLSAGNDLSYQKQQPAAAKTFPRFFALPPEIRLLVWRCFAPICPGRGPQVLAFEAWRPDGRKGAKVAIPCPSLVRQTASIRAVLAVNRESRFEALRAFPHTLGKYSCDKLAIRFDAERDVILLDKRPKQECRPPIWGIPIQEFAEHIRQLAIGPHYFDKYRLNLRHPRWLMRFLKLFERLVVVYYALDASVLEEASCAWCVSTEVHQVYKAETEASEKTLRRPEVLYCWPNLDSHRQYAQQEKSMREPDYSGSHRLHDFLGMLYGEMPPPRRFLYTISNDPSYLLLTHEDVRRLGRWSIGRW